MPVRALGTFLNDPLDVPPAVVDYLAGQLGITDPSCVKNYLEREKTRFEHQWEIIEVGQWRDFGQFEAELRQWVDDRAWTTGDGPKAIFDGAVGWLRERRVLLPGVTTLTRLVAGVADAALQRLWDTVAGMVNAELARVLVRLLEVADGARVSAPGAPRHLRDHLHPVGRSPRPPADRPGVDRGARPDPQRPAIARDAGGGAGRVR